MALTAIYERFLTSPNPLSLSENASLHYIPTLTSYTQSGPIIRHLESQKNNMVKMKSQKVISAVEGASSVALEVDTTMEFIGSGGAYLPNLDNFIIDKIAILPIVSPALCPPDMFRLLTAPDTHRPVWPRPEDLSDPSFMGPGLLVEADRCHWVKRSELACL